MKTIKLTENQIYIIKRSLDDYYESNETAIDGSEEYIREIRSNADMKEDIKREKALNAKTRSEQRIIKNIYKKL